MHLIVNYTSYRLGRGEGGFYFPAEQTEETPPRSERLTVQLQTCLWSEVSGEVGFFLVSCYKGLETRNVGISLSPIMPRAFKDNNVRPSCHCVFKQASSFLNPFFFSSAKQSCLFPWAGFQWKNTWKSGDVRWSTSAPRLPQKELGKHEEEGWL